MQGLLPKDKVLDFIISGKAFITAKSLDTQRHFTYKISCPRSKRKLPNNQKNLWWVSLLTGNNNETNYTYFGTIKRYNNSFIYQHSTKTHIKDSALGVIAFKYILKNLIDNKSMKVEFFHEGKCCKCGRLLTNPESIKKGIGPECEKN